MINEESLIYNQIMAYSVDEAIWNISYINNAIFNTPLKKDTRSKVFSLNDSMIAIFSEAFPGNNKLNELGVRVLMDSRYFVELVEGNDLRRTAAEIKKDWKENNSNAAKILNELNPYWKYLEFNGMLDQRTDILSLLTSYLKNSYYDLYTELVPIYRRVTLDISNYLIKGILIVDEQQ